MKKLTLVVLAFTFSAPLAAESIPYSAMAKCAAITENASRLQCFDQLAQATPAEAKSATGKWQLEDHTNPLDDTVDITLTLLADSGTNRSGRPFMLTAHCDSHKTQLAISWYAYLGSQASVTLRIGSGEANTSRWDVSADKQATISTVPVQTLKDMLSADKMVAQVTPFNQKPYTAIFDLSGLEAAIEPVRATCRW